ncbi:MAG: ubiquinol-cytochrome C chaperone family protein [Pseudomonadota bacterium]
MARNPVFYADMDVPDTVMGRFEMMTLTMVVFLRRTHKRDEALTDLAQSIVDTFFEDMDHSIRELGVGDVSVPKRMKKLARMFYGRAQSYGDAFNDSDKEELARCLARNLYPPDRPSSGEAPVDMHKLAAAAIELETQMAGLADEDLLSGQLKLQAEIFEHK